MTLRAGDTVGGYRIEDVAGRGAMGIVYRAIDPDLRRPVALKVIAPELAGDEEFARRFQRESRVAASLEHPNIVPVYRAGRDGDRIFLAMRYVDGLSLEALIDRHGPLAPAEAAEITAQVAGAADFRLADDVVRSVRFGSR